MGIYHNLLAFEHFWCCKQRFVGVQGLEDLKPDRQILDLLM